MELKQLDPYRWEIPQSGNMRVHGIVYSSPDLITSVIKEEAAKQVANVAQLPGIVKASLAMPDIHWGYGFPIGGVAAFNWQTGIISPGGVGYDINCGVRLAATDLTHEGLRAQLPSLIEALYRKIPCGVGSKGPLKLSPKEERKVLTQGSRWTLHQGLATDTDIAHTEDGGCLENADPAALSDRALERGRSQLGTLGSGNHFLEIGLVQKIYLPEVAQRFGLSEGQITVMIHSGSRGLGYQVCDDALAKMARQAHKLDFQIPDRQLACAMIHSSQGTQYLSAMACAANYAWANRQIMMDNTRNVFLKALGISPRDLNMRLVYDVCHNIAKKEAHLINGQKQTLCVHRKGATRAFAPGHPALCEDYRDVGQPILVPGDMGTASYVMVGTQQAMEETFGSTCHGAGRVLSRNAAKKASRGRSIQQELEKKGILVKWTGRTTLAEEMPEAYKDVSQVVNVAHESGISLKVAKLKPLAVIKG